MENTKSNKMEMAKSANVSEMVAVIISIAIALSISFSAKTSLATTSQPTYSISVNK